MKEIVKVSFGSHLYGTSTPASDFDYKSVYLPDSRAILLGKVNKSIRTDTKYQREQQVAGIISRNLPGDLDNEYLAMQHFFDMLAKGQPMCLDILFAVDENLITTSHVWEEVRNNKHRLINRNIEESIRYMSTQSKKYGTKGSRVAECRRFRDLFKECYETDSSGKISSIGDYIKAVTKGMEHSSVIQIPQPNNTMLDHLECVGKKLPFTITFKEAHSVLDNFMKKYGQRALDAENNQGVDWKALSHAVRVGVQTIELLETGNIVFPRPDAEYLMAIKRGDIHFKEVSETISDLADEVKTITSVSVLPTEIDQAWVDDFVCNTYRDVVIGSTFTNRLSRAIVGFWSKSYANRSV